MLANTTTGFTPDATLLRKLAQNIAQTCEIDLASADGKLLANYLRQKGFAKEHPGRTTKYHFSLPGDSPSSESHRVRVQRVDIWLASPEVPSTVGTPTIDNRTEYIDLATQLGYITKAKRNWTAAGLATARLRERHMIANPFALNTDAMLAFRQLLLADGLMMVPLLCYLRNARDGPVERDFVAREVFPNMCDQAVTYAKELRLPPKEQNEIRQLARTVSTTAQRRSAGSSAPGVLEHRITPRLEWLVDLGVLSKDGLRKNSFTYAVPESLVTIAERLRRAGSNVVSHADEIALDWWRERHLTASSERAGRSPRDALLSAYALTRRPVGPAPIRETVLLAAACCEASLGELRNELLEWAGSDRKVTLSGGRYARSPELVHIAG